MRSFQVILAAVSVFSAVPSFAGPMQHGPCASYVGKCKEDASVKNLTDNKAKWAAMGECISAAAKADAPNGQKCLDAMAKYKAKKAKQ